MVKVTERKGSAHVFSLEDKSTFRLFPYEVKTIKDSSVSENLRSAEKLGIISLEVEAVKLSSKEIKKNKEV